MKPQIIADFELDGERFEMAKNGRYSLVRIVDRDFLENPIREELDVSELYAYDPGKAAALLNALVQRHGEALVKLGHAENFRKAVAGGGGE